MRASRGEKESPRATVFLRVTRFQPRQEQAITISSQDERFVHELKDLYDAEHQLLETAVELLEQTLEEEKAADEKLTEIAGRGVNASADNEGDEEEEKSERTARPQSRTANRPKPSAPARRRRAKK